VWKALTGKREPKIEVAQLIEEVLLCEAFRCLPRAGGLYDQDFDWIDRAKVVKSAISDLRQQKQKAISKGK
jgi:hypothetical protein